MKITKQNIISSLEIYIFGIIFIELQFRATVKSSQNNLECFYDLKNSFLFKKIIDTLNGVKWCCILEIS